MEQKQLKMWLPSFLTWRAERVLQKQAEMGYLLIAVENFGSFYTFSFERRMRNTAKYHVELLVTWLLLPVICLIVLTVTNTPWEWGNKTAYAMLMGTLLMYHAAASIISYIHR